jgi:hypothetical protein
MHKCQRYGMDCCTMDDCIAPYEVHYIGGRDPPRAGGQGGRRPREAPPVEAAPGGGSTP